MTDYTLAANVIIHFEHFSAKAYWDVNHYRIGYGSDTIGAAQTPCLSNSVTTRDDAMANLIARIPQYENIIIQQIGADMWLPIPDISKAALLSLCYNYGSLPHWVWQSLSAELNPIHIQYNIYALASDNGGINASRRKLEGDLYSIGYAVQLS